MFDFVANIAVNSGMSEEAFDRYRGNASAIRSLRSCVEACSQHTPAWYGTPQHCLSTNLRTWPEPLPRRTVNKTTNATQTSIDCPCAAKAQAWSDSVHAVNATLFGLACLLVSAQAVIAVRDGEKTLVFAITRRRVFSYFHCNSKESLRKANVVQILATILCVGISASLLVQVKILQKSLLVNRNARMVNGSSVLAPNFDAVNRLTWSWGVIMLIALFLIWSMAQHIEQWIHRRAYAVAEAAAVMAGVSVARSANVEQSRQPSTSACYETCFQCASYPGTRVERIKLALDELFLTKRKVLSIHARSGSRQVANQASQLFCLLPRGHITGSSYSARSCA